MGIIQIAAIVSIPVTMLLVGLYWYGSYRREKRQNTPPATTNSSVVG